MPHCSGAVNTAEDAQRKGRSCSAGTLSKTLEEFLFYCVFDLGGSQRFGLAVALTFFRLLIHSHNFRSHLREGVEGEF